MTTPTPSVESAPAQTCCGSGNSWSPKAGEPLAVSCMLCPNSTTTYWRTHRADGQPYEPVKPLSEADAG